VSTPLIRPQNIPLILPHLEAGREHVDLRWVISPDVGHGAPDWWTHEWFPQKDWVLVYPVNVEPRPSPMRGEFLQNAVLDWLEKEGDGWFWGLADDTVPADGFFKAVAREAQEGTRAIVFPMARGTKIICGGGSNTMSPGSVDGAQVVWSLKAIEGQRFQAISCLDGEFIERLYSRDKGKGWSFNGSIPVQYNALR